MSGHKQYEVYQYFRKNKGKRFTINEIIEQFPESSRQATRDRLSDLHRFGFLGKVAIKGTPYFKYYFKRCNIKK